MECGRCIGMVMVWLFLLLGLRLAECLQRWSGPSRVSYADLLIRFACCEPWMHFPYAGALIPCPNVGIFGLGAIDENGMYPYVGRLNLGAVEEKGMYPLHVLALRVATESISAKRRTYHLNSDRGRGQRCNRNQNWNRKPHG